MMTNSSDAVSSKLSGLSESVRTSSQEMTAGLNQVRQLAEALCSELERGCALALRAESVTELFDEQLLDFDQVFEQLGYTEEMASVAAGSNQADDLSKLYSMESERRIHLEVFGGEASAAETQADSELGCEVELF